LTTRCQNAWGEPVTSLRPASIAGDNRPNSRFKKSDSDPSSEKAIFHQGSKSKRRETDVIGVTAFCARSNLALMRKREDSELSADKRGEVEWDGEALSGWVEINGKPMKVRVTRDMIHEHASGFNDAVTWEIERHRREIFDRLIPCLVELNSKL
jgi:hypothetical protein